VFVDLFTAEKTYHVNSSLTCVLDVSYTFGWQIVTAINYVRISYLYLCLLQNQTPIHNWTVPKGSRRLSFPEFLESQYINLARLAALVTGRLWAL